MLNTADVQSWSWRLLRIIAAAFLGVVCFGIGIRPTTERLRSYIGARGSYSGPSNAEWKLVDGMPHAYNAELTVRLDATPEQVSGWLRVKLPAPHITTLQWTMSKASSRMRWSWIVQRYTGTVLIGGTPMEYSSVIFHMPRGEAYGFVDVILTPTPIRVDASPTGGITVERGYQARSGKTTTHIETRGGVKVIGRSATPIEQSNGAAEWVTRGDTEIVLVNFAPPPTRSEERRRRVTEVLLSYDAQYRRVIQPLISGFIYSIPFVLLIALYRRLRTKPPEDESNDAISVSIAFIVLILGVEITNAAFDLYFGPFVWLRTRVLEKCYDAFLSTGGAAAIGAAFVVWYWPIFMHRARTGRNGTTSPRTRLQLWFLIILTTAATVFSALGLCWREEWFFSHLTVPILGSVAAILCIAAVSSELASENQALFDGITTIAVATSLELIDVVFPQSNNLRFAAVALLALPMVFSILRLLRPTWTKSTILGLSAAICALLVVGRQPQYSLWWEAVASSLAGSLAPALRFAVAVYLWRLLKRLSKDGKWNELEDDERDAGCVLALTFFFLPAHRWLYIVVAFAVGWLVLKKWVFDPRKLVTPGKAEDVPATIREVIRLNEAESALRALKKAQRAKIAKGEINFEEYEESVSALEKKVADLHARVRPTADAPPAAVLSSGTEMKPWDRAMVGMNYGLLLGIPWLALLLHRFHSGFAPDRGYDWVQSIAIALTAMAQWPILGFFFGYFYPHLRGNTGLTKGLFLFLSVVTPIFTATALTLPPDKQTLTLFFFYALQLLIHCMLLGFFAGDYETLRASGLSWRHVLDVHNLGSIAAWTSTLIIAIGAAVATEFMTKASKFIVQALQAAVPDLPRTQ